VGAIERHKGFDFLVEATALLPEDLRPSLHIAANDGNPYLRTQLEGLAERLGVKLSIGLGQSQAQLDLEYRGALVFLWASHQEPLGLAPLEAMARGVPVVAVAEGGVRDTVADGRTGYLVARDPVEFAGRLRRLLESPAERRFMGAAARAEVATRWTWPARAAALESELLALAGMAATPSSPNPPIDDGALAPMHAIWRPGSSAPQLHSYRYAPSGARPRTTIWRTWTPILSTPIGGSGLGVAG
jgi:glycosyltransferase involved in cell wall biosynthesis